MKYITPYIAAQCPSAGGNAVFQARGVLSLLGYTPDFDDYATCAMVQSPWRQAQGTGHEADISVYPNPNEGVFYITFPSNYAETVYHIYDAYGRSLQKGKLGSMGKEEIDIHTYGQGIYILNIAGQNFKLIVQ